MYEFNKIVGNKNIINNLKNSIKNNLIFHCYIIDGAKKSGKKMIAKTFAKALLCKQNKGGNPCLKCNSCLAFENNNNPDVIYIYSEKKSLGIQEIRENVIKNIEIKPFGKYKIFIIYDAHTMTIQAQNAILKTIEAPPKFVVFLLISQNYNQFLQTILSRAILLKIRPLPLNLIQDYLYSLNIPKDNVPLYTSYSEGSIGRALDILQSESFLTMRESIIQEIKDFESKSLLNIYKMITFFENYKQNIQEVLDILLLIYRDSLIYKHTNDNKNIIQKDIEHMIRDISNMSVKNLSNKIDNILNTKLYLKQNANFNLALESLFLKLKEKYND